MPPSPRTSLSLVTASLLSATVVSLAAPQQAQALPPQPTKVQVSQVSATERATARGTQVTVTYTLTNHTGRDKPARKTKLVLLTSSGASRYLGVVKAPALVAGSRSSFTRTLRVAPTTVAGDYTVRVCSTPGPDAACSTSAPGAVTVAPAVLTASTGALVVPQAGGGETARLRLTNTGQGRTGALALRIESDEQAQPGRAPAVDPYEITATTCGGFLGAGTSCTVDVTNTGEGSPAAVAQLVVAGRRIASTATLLVGPVHVAPVIGEFGPVEVGSAAFKTLEVRNGTDEPVLVLNGSIEDFENFSYDVYGASSFTCADTENIGQPVEVAPGGSCTITVRFAPSAPGVHPSVGVVSTSAGDTYFRLSGTGIAGQTSPPVRPGARSFPG